MNFEVEFQGSEVVDIIKNSEGLEIILDRVPLLPKNSDDRNKIATVKVFIHIAKAKYSKLPKKGILTDGELYGIPGKALNGRIPLDYQSSREVELSLAYEDQEFIVKGKGIRIMIDPASLPAELKH